MKNFTKFSICVLVFTIAFGAFSMMISFASSLGLLSWVLYACTIYCVVYFLVLPFFSFGRYSTPIVELPLEKDKKFEAKTMQEYENVIKNMAKTFSDEESKEALAAISVGYKVIEASQKLVAHRLELVDKKIKDIALLVFVTTFVNKSSKIDALSVLFYNLKLISDISSLMGFRPHKWHWFKLYANVLFTAFVAYNLEDILESLLPQDFIPMMGISLGLEGLSNAVVTMRIGYIAKYYISSPECFDKKNARKTSNTFVRKNVKGLWSTAKNIDIISNLFKNSDKFVS